MDTETRQKVVIALKNGSSYESISRMFGISNSTIAKVKKDEGIVSTKISKKDYTKMVTDAKKWDEIAPRIDEIIKGGPDKSETIKEEETIDVDEILVNSDSEFDSVAEQRLEQAKVGRVESMTEDCHNRLVESCKRLAEFGAIMRKEPTQMDLSGKPAVIPTIPTLPKTTFSFDEKLDILDAIKSQMVGCKASHWGELAEKWKKFMQE